MTIDEAPFEKLRIGLRVRSVRGFEGKIAGLWKEGETDITGGYCDYGGHILFIWHNEAPSWSLTYKDGLKVEILEPL